MIYSTETKNSIRASILEHWNPAYGKFLYVDSPEAGATEYFLSKGADPALLVPINKDVGGAAKIRAVASDAVAVVEGDVHSYIDATFMKEKVDHIWYDLQSHFVPRETLVKMLRMGRKTSGTVTFAHADKDAVLADLHVKVKEAHGCFTIEPTIYRGSGDVMNMVHFVAELKVTKRERKIIDTLRANPLLATILDGDMGHREPPKQVGWVTEWELERMHFALRFKDDPKYPWLRSMINQPEDAGATEEEEEEDVVMTQGSATTVLDEEEEEEEDVVMTQGSATTVPDEEEEEQEEKKVSLTKAPLVRPMLTRRGVAATRTEHTLWEIAKQHAPLDKPYARPPDKDALVHRPLSLNFSRWQGEDDARVVAAVHIAMMLAYVVPKLEVPFGNDQVPGGGPYCVFPQLCAIPPDVWTAYCEVAVKGMCQMNKTLDQIAKAFVAYFLEGCLPVIFLRKNGGKSDADAYKEAIGKFNAEVARIYGLLYAKFFRRQKGFRHDLHEDLVLTPRLASRNEFFQFNETGSVPYALRGPQVFVACCNTTQIDNLVKKPAWRGCRLTVVDICGGWKTPDDPRGANPYVAHAWGDGEPGSCPRERVLPSLQAIFDEDDENQAATLSDETEGRLFKPMAESGNINEHPGKVTGGLRAVAFRVCTFTATPTQYLHCPHGKCVAVPRVVQLTPSRNYVGMPTEFMREIAPHCKHFVECIEQTPRCIVGYAAKSDFYGMFIEALQINPEGFFELFRGKYRIMKERKGHVVSGIDDKTYDYATIEGIHQEMKDVDKTWAEDGGNVVQMLQEMNASLAHRCYANGIIMTENTRTEQQKRVWAKNILLTAEEEITNDMVVVMWAHDRISFFARDTSVVTAIRATHEGGMNTIGEMIRQEHGKFVELRCDTKTASINIAYDLLYAMGAPRLKVVVLVGVIGRRAVTFKTTDHKMFATHMYACFKVSPYNKLTTNGADVVQGMMGRLCGMMTDDALKGPPPRLFAPRECFAVANKFMTAMDLLPDFYNAGGSGDARAAFAKDGVSLDALLDVLKGVAGRGGVSLHRCKRKNEELASTLPGEYCDLVPGLDGVHQEGKRRAFVTQFARVMPHAAPLSLALTPRSTTGTSKPFKGLLDVEAAQKVLDDFGVRLTEDDLPLIFEACRKHASGWKSEMRGAAKDATPNYYTRAVNGFIVSGGVDISGDWFPTVWARDRGNVLQTLLDTFVEYHGDPRFRGTAVTSTGKTNHKAAYTPLKTLLVCLADILKYVPQYRLACHIEQSFDRTKLKQNTVRDYVAAVQAMVGENVVPFVEACNAMEDKDIRSYVDHERAKKQFIHTKAVNAMNYFVRYVRRRNGKLGGLTA